MSTVVVVENANCIADIDPNFDCRNLKEGDLYVGKRNGGWKLGICDYVTDGFVQAKMAMIYSYDCCECRKVIKLISLDAIKIN